MALIVLRLFPHGEFLRQRTRGVIGRGAAELCAQPPSPMGRAPGEGRRGAASRSHHMIV